jgi:hypothetical protein
VKLHNDDGLGDILYIEEEPNKRKACGDLCGKSSNIVQMKGTGQYICVNTCDEGDNYYICKYCDNITCDDNPDCIECKKEICMELYQTHCKSAALNLHKAKKRTNCV